MPWECIVVMSCLILMAKRIRDLIWKDKTEVQNKYKTVSKKKALIALNDIEIVYKALNSG